MSSLEKSDRDSVKCTFKKDVLEEMCLKYALRKKSGNDIFQNTSLI